MSEKNIYKRIGVMGGTFDPIHNGHLAVAEAARRDFGLERVVFIPTGMAPHKNNKLITSASQRFEMTVLATSGNDYFDVSKMEIERRQASYTVDTLEELQLIYGKKTKLYFIAGADSLAEILTWKSPERIFRLCSLITAPRPGIGAEIFNRHAETARKRGANICVLSAPPLDISSTDIRRRIQIERPVRYLLPDAVEGYIKNYRLYRGDGFDMEEAERRVSASLSDKRWAHTVGAINESVRLAEIYGVDRRKAYIAAVFHDWAKEMPPGEKLANCERWGIRLDSATRSQIDLAHGLLSAEMARLEFNVEDPEILNAIRYHTTGREHMSTLDKILLTADCIEPSRKKYDGLESIREMAPVDLDKAAAMTLEMKIDFTVSKDQEVHPLSIKALDEASRIWTAAALIDKGDYNG